MSRQVIILGRIAGMAEAARWTVHEPGILLVENFIADGMIDLPSGRLKFDFVLGKVESLDLNNVVLETYDIMEKIEDGLWAENVGVMEGEPKE